jgi:hypothetical protein
MFSKNWSGARLSVDVKQTKNKNLNVLFNTKPNMATLDLKYVYRIKYTSVPNYKTFWREQIWCTQVPVLLIFLVFKNNICVFQKIINFISQIHTHVLNTRVNIW